MVIYVKNGLLTSSVCCDGKTWVDRWNAVAQFLGGTRHTPIWREFDDDPADNYIEGYHITTPNGDLRVFEDGLLFSVYR